MYGTMLLELSRWSFYKKETTSYMAILDTGKISILEAEAKSALTEFIFSLKY